MVRVICIKIKKYEIKKSYNKKISNNNSFIVGLGVSFANPIAIVLWISLSGSYLTQFVSNYIAFLNIVTIFMGFLVFYFPLATIINFTRHKISLKYVILISKVFGVILIGYGLRFLYQFWTLVVS